MNDLKIKELVLKIINKSIEKTATTEADVFVDFSGHVRSLRVCIHKNGYRLHDNNVLRKETYLEPKEEYMLTKEDIINNLQKIYDVIYAL